MPVQSRKVVIEQQKRRNKLGALKKVRKAVNTGLVVFSTATFMSGVSKSSQVLAQEATSTRTTVAEFLGFISEKARQIAASNDLYASVMIAQAALESGWGNSALSQAPHYNLFGIKGTSSDNVVNMNTLEDDGSGNYYTAYEPFKSYGSYEGSLQDYASLLTGNNDPSSWRYNFYNGARVSTTNSYQDATAHLTGRYATDTAYATKLNSIIQQNNLTQYDSPASSSGASTSTASAPAASTTASTATGGYTVASGDTYWSLARKFGVSAAELQQLNGATSSSLFVGQSIKVPSGASSTASSQTTPSLMASSATTASTPSASSTVATGGYTVASGDTYWSLARKFGVSVADLQRLNGASGDTLLVGQALKVPGASAAASTATASTSSTSTSATTASAPASSSSAAGGYTVASGDTYWSLARKFGVSVADLQRANNSSSSTLFVGQSLIVPGGSSASAEVVTTQTSAPAARTTASVPTSAPATSGNYTVASGDTLWSIASRHQTTVAQILSANGLSEGSVIVPGQSLVVSGGSAVAVTETVAPAAVADTTRVATPAPVAQGGSYTVASGDTLYSIARRVGVDVNTLIANNGGSTVIGVGQVISY